MKTVFMIDGGAGRAIAAIPALIKYYKKNKDFQILVNGWDSMFWGIPELHDRVFNPDQKGAMEQFYEKVINNTLNDIDKIHLKLILKKYSNRLEKYNETYGCFTILAIYYLATACWITKGRVLRL